MIAKIYVLFVALLDCAGAIAEPVKGEAELGFVNTNGNSETQTVNAKLKLTKDTEKWAHQANLAALSNSNSESTTAEKYTAAFQSDRKLDERSFLYGLATYEDDRFSGFKYQATVGAGYGYKVINNDERTLTLEIGPGYRVNSVDDVVDANGLVIIPGDEESEVTLRLGEIYVWKFSETAEFNQYLTVEGGEDNTITNLGVSVKSALTGALALKLGIDMKMTDKVPSGRDDTDTETYATVTYSF
jgi:putative salt-induced outer membrane protein